MSLSNNTVWEVRPSVGSDTNGGAFVSGASGTDYSQQNAKNSSGNNISTTDGVGNGTTTWTSATASFTSAIIGNVIYLAGSGITTGWYQVTAYTNGTTIVLDRNPGTGTGITMNIGGALATISQSISNAGTFHTIYVKATAAYTVASTQTININSVSNNNPLSIIGYTTTRGDNGQFTWTTATNSVDLIQITGGANYLFKNIIFSSTAGTPSHCIYTNTGPVGTITCVNCKMSGFVSAIQSEYGVDGYPIQSLNLMDCEIHNCTSHALAVGANLTIVACFIHDNGADGIIVVTDNTAGVTRLFIERSVIYNNTGNGITLNAPNLSTIVLINMAFVSNTGDGLKQSNASPTPAVVMLNNIFYGNGGYGINALDAIQLHARQSNAFGSNTSGNYYNLSVDATDVALTGNPFTSPSTGDFSLNNTSGAGASCKGAGYPTVLP